MSKIEVSNTENEYNTATITFPTDPGPGSAWLTVDPNNGRPKFSVNIVRTDEGLVVDVYADGQEDGGPVATTYAFDTDTEEEPSSITARFTPEAWRNDYAIEVDPLGETEWRVSVAMAGEVRDAVANGEPNMDFLKYDSRAPRWIKNWQGPFTINVETEAEDPS